ncbi:hypothetical protein RHS01_11443 [Rhizoctonia solani]|uniref:Endonuclease/exonuclease/phosphatase domain-containing protein n=1 Tax=Rhizoctonia solani TaxID=456999 RepID=A0A8H7LWD0_9AGAM|nr:hypothetical protein RHS01_11443 [Rhizoctonia solani]
MLLTTPIKNPEKPSTSSPSSLLGPPRKRSRKRSPTLSPYLTSPQPQPHRAPHVASPKAPLVPTSPHAIMIVNSSQEYEQIKDAVAGFERLTEHTSDNGSQAGTPRSVAMDLAEDSRPMSTTPKTNRFKHVRRLTPMHDLTWNPEDQHWLDRLEDGAYPCDDALECALKYSQITAKVIRSIINNRVTQDETPSEQNSTIKFIKSIAKISEGTFDHADRTSHIYPQCIREGKPMKVEPTTAQADNEEMETDNDPDWDNHKPGKGWGLAPTHPQHTNPFIDFDPTSGRLSPNPNPPTTSSTDNPILNLILKKLEQLDNINTRLSRLEGSKPQAKPAQTPAASPVPKHTQNPNNPSNVSWADVAAKGNSKAPEVKASNIASALQEGHRKPSPAQSNDRNFVVRFKTLPVTQPNPESIFVSMRECLDAANRTLGKGRLTRVRWTLKASLHLSFSNSASITAIENAIPLLMDKLKMPEYEFGPKTRATHAQPDELTQLLRDSFPEEAKFGDLKITLAPDWLADPARLQAEGRQASTVSFAFEDAGALPRTVYSLTHNYLSTDADAKSRNSIPNPCYKSPGATNADATITQPNNTTLTTALDAPETERTFGGAALAPKKTLTPINRIFMARLPLLTFYVSSPRLQLHILAVDLKLDNSPLTIINCYPHGKSLKDTIDNITNINIPMDRPCIMARDFNLHHPEWALTGSKWEHHQPNAQERMFKAYAEYQDLHVLNHLSLPTHIVPRSPTSNAIIDLTLLNSQAVDAWPNLNWEVEAQSSGKSLGSDHMAITWTIGPHNQAKSAGVTEPSPRHLIDTSRQKKWTQEYMQQVQKNPPPTDPVAAKDADRITTTILEAMSNATRLVMPSPRVKRRLAQLDPHGGQTSGTKLRAALQGAIRRARKSQGDKILAEISTQRVFDVLKWYQGKRRSIIPPILPTSQLPPRDTGTTRPKEHPKKPYQPITSAEVRSALKLTSNRSAPGAFGSNYQLLKWAFNASRISLSSSLTYV